LAYRVRIADRAQRQINKAGDWWLRNRSKAPFAFADDFDSALDLLETLPGAGESVPHQRIRGLRRLFISRVRYFLYYTIDESSELIQVLALWHASRGQAPRL